MSRKPNRVYSGFKNVRLRRSELSSLVDLLSSDGSVPVEIYADDEMVESVNALVAIPDPIDVIILKRKSPDVLIKMTVDDLLMSTAPNDDIAYGLMAKFRDFVTPRKPRAGRVLTILQYTIALLIGLNVNRAISRLGAALTFELLFVLAVVAFVAGLKISYVVYPFTGPIRFRKEPGPRPKWREIAYDHWKIAASAIVGAAVALIVNRFLNSPPKVAAPSTIQCAPPVPPNLRSP